MSALAPGVASPMRPVDTIVGGVAVRGDGSPWARKGGAQANEPEKKSLSDLEQFRTLEEPATPSIGDLKQAWLPTVLQDMEIVAGLEEDWDGYGAGPIRRDVLWYALRLLQSVMGDFPAPQVTPMSNEGVLLEWHRDDVRLDIEIEDAGEAYVSYENEESGIDYGWEVGADFTSLLEPLRAIAEKNEAFRSSAA